MATFFAIAASMLLASAQTVDLVTFTPPEGFTFDAREGHDHATLTHAEKTNYCVISIYRAVPRNADLAAQLAIDWKDPLHATGDMPEPVTRKTAGGGLALEASGPATVGGQERWGDLIDVDAGASVVTITAIAPSEDLFAACRKPLDAMLAGLAVKKNAARAAAAAPEGRPAAPTAGVRVTAAEMTGEWTTGASSSVGYVDSSSGAYAGSSTVFYGERYNFHADGTYDYSFSGMSNGHIVREKKTGAWALGGTAITVTPKGSPGESYNLVSFEKGADGAKVLTVLRAAYPLTSGNLGLYGEKWQHIPKK